MSKIEILKQIIEGFKNYNFPSEESEKIAMERAAVCASCEFANPNHPFRKLLDDNRIETINGLGCKKCGCLLSAKTRSPLSSCPENKWKR